MTMTGDDLEQIGKAAFGRTWRAELAREFGVTTRTVSRWRATHVDGRARAARIREICGAATTSSPDSLAALLVEGGRIVEQLNSLMRRIAVAGRESGVEPKSQESVSAPSVQKSKSPLKPGMSNEERRAIYGVKSVINGVASQRAPYERESVFILTNQFPPGRHAISTVVSKAGPEWAKMADGMPVREYLRDFLDGMNRAFERGDYVESALDDLGKVRVESGFLVIDP